jgi:DNA primase
LPEGQDPDDLARSGGREAIAEVLGSARALADMLWLRETESSSFETPERRAALESRLNEIVRGIGDEAVRRYYMQDFTARLRALFAPVNAPLPFNRERSFQPRWAERGGSRAGVRQREPFPTSSPRLGTSSLVRGFKSALPPREALILLAVLHHPWLLETHAEEFAEIEFRHGDADLLRRAILEAVTEASLDSAALQDCLMRRGLESVLARIKVAITHNSDWPAAEGAAEEDVAQWWTHVVTLHRKKRTLNRELKDAERALGEEPSEANLAWIRDVQGRLAALEGNEALIEGFGIPSGRPARSV